MAMNARADEVANLTPDEVAAGLRARHACCWSTCASRTKPPSKAIRTPCSCRCRASIRPPSPIRKGRQVVFACRSGRRSVTASLAAQDRGYPYNAHLAGGIMAWKAAGLPTKTD